MLHDTCYTMYDTYYLFYLLNPKIISKGGQKWSFLTPKSVRFRSQIGPFSVPKGGFKSGKLKDRKSASHCSQKQYLGIRQPPVRAGREPFPPSDSLPIQFHTINVHRLRGASRHHPPSATHLPPPISRHRPHKL